MIPTSATVSVSSCLRQLTRTMRGAGFSEDAIAEFQKAFLVTHGVEIPAEKEWEKLNGEITTVNTKQPMNWEEFKALPKGLQETYFNTVIDTYNCGMKGMAGMFGVSTGGLSQYIRTHGLNTSPQKKGRKPNNQKWEEFLSGEKRKPPVVRWSVTVAAKTWEEVFEAVKHFPIYAGVTISVE